MQELGRPEVRSSLC